MNRWPALFVFAASLCLGGSAFAQTTEEATEPSDSSSSPTSEGVATSGQTYVGRDITATGGKFDFFVGPVPRPLLPDAGLRFDAGGDNLHLDAGLAYGITDDFEVGAYLLRFRIFQDGDIDSPVIWGGYQFLRGDIDIALRLSIPLPIFGGDFFVGADLPIVFRFGGNARLETGVAFSITFSDPAIAGIFIPLRPVFNVTSQIFLGLDTGLGIPFTDGGVAFVPLGVFGGYSITPNIDIGLALRFGRLWANDDNGMGLDDPSIGLGVNLYEIL